MKSGDLLPTMQTPTILFVEVATVKTTLIYLKAIVLVDRVFSTL